jgi:uncharacterized protein
MIIDAHTHIFPESVKNERESFCDRDAAFSSLYGSPKARIASAEDLIASMDEAGVDRSVICGFPWGGRELCSFHNDYLLDAFSRYPDRLIAFLSLPFSDPEWSELELDRGLKAGARGVGEAAFYGCEMTSQDIASMGPVLGRMEAESIPLLLHVNELVGHPYPGKGTTPLDRYYELIVSFPHLPFLLAHWGGGLPFYELMPEVRKAMSRVYYDTAASPFLYSKEVYAAVSRIVGPEKILFGTDFPLLGPRRYFDQLDASGLSPEARDRILGLNLSRIIGIEPE